MARRVMLRKSNTPKSVSSIDDVRKYNGSWLICLPGCGNGSTIISVNGKLFDEPTGTEFTEDEILQISCYDEDAGVTYKRLF